MIKIDFTKNNKQNPQEIDEYNECISKKHVAVIETMKGTLVIGTDNKTTFQETLCKFIAKNTDTRYRIYIKNRR